MQKTATRTEDTQTQKYTVKIIFYRLKKSEKIDQQIPPGAGCQLTKGSCWSISARRTCVGKPPAKEVTENRQQTKPHRSWMRCLNLTKEVMQGTKKCIITLVFIQSTSLKVYSKLSTVAFVSVVYRWAAFRRRSEAWEQNCLFTLVCW